MCSPARCRSCGKTTWSGCGQHADQVLAMVPPADRCPGHTAQQPAPSQGSWWRR